jgi:hypothetical protein
MPVMSGDSPPLTADAGRKSREVPMTMPSQQYPPGPPNRSMGQRMSDSRQRSKDAIGAVAAQVIGPHLEPGEQMLGGTRAHTGPSDWLRFIPRVGSIIRLVQTHYYVMLTDRRVIFCGVSYWGHRPSSIRFVVPRAGVQASGYTVGALYPSFLFSSPARPKPMRIRIRSLWEPETLRILGALGMPLPGMQQPQAVQGYQPQQQGYQPPQGYQPQQQGYQPPPQQPQQQGYQPYDAPTQYQAPPQGYQPAPPQQYQDQQPQQPGYQSGPYEAPTQYHDPQSGSGRHRGN